MIISNSDRCSFKDCRRKWDLGSPNRQNLRIKKKQTPLWLGSLVHLCLEGFYLGQYPTAFEAFMAEGRKIPAQEREEYADAIVLGGNMLRHYSMVYPSLADEPFTVLGIEVPFQHKLNNKGDIFAGTIDGIIRFKDNGKVGILEHKTFAMHKNEELHDIDDQTSIYPAALNHLIREGKVPGTTPDDFCDVVLYNGLWKKIPGELKLNKNGSVSKTCLTNMTPQWLEHSKKVLGLEGDLGLDSIEDLEHNVGRFFPRREIPRGELEQRLAINRLLKEFGHMDEAGQLPWNDPDLYHNPSTECAWKCPFVRVCVGMNCGADVEIIKSALYEQAPSRGTTYEKSVE